jgi:hypothetical protein
VPPARPLCLAGTSAERAADMCKGSSCLYVERQQLPIKGSQAVNSGPRLL